MLSQSCLCVPQLLVIKADGLIIYTCRLIRLTNSRLLSSLYALDTWFSSESKTPHPSFALYAHLSS